VEKSLSYQARREVLQRQVAAQPCRRGTADAWALTAAHVWTGRPTHALYGLARRQPDLRQTAHALSPYLTRGAGAA
jgi:hypothetical protein